MVNGARTSNMSQVEVLVVDVQIKFETFVWFVTVVLILPRWWRDKNTVTKRKRY